MSINSTQKLQEPYSAVWVDSFTSSLPPPSNPESVTVADTVADLQAGLLVKMCQPLESVDDYQHSNKRLSIDALETNESSFPSTVNYDGDMTKAGHLTVLVMPRKEDRDKIAGYYLATKMSAADMADSFKALNRKLVSMYKELQAGQERMQAKLMQQETELEE